MKKGLTILVLLFSLLAVCACSSYKNPPKTVDKVQLKKYMGKWYEIASFPNRFQKGCRCTSAHYTLENQKIIILNQCARGTDKQLDSAKGTAWLPNPKDTAKLKVQFFWPFRGDYWILYLGPNYEYALVGNPSRKYLWILSRKKTMDSKTYNMLLNIAKQKAYDVSRLKKTLQNCPNL